MEDLLERLESALADRYQIERELGRSLRGDPRFRDLVQRVTS